MSLLTDDLLQSLNTLLRSGNQIPATDLRAFEAQMIAAVAVLEARARGNTIHYTEGVPADALGLEGDLGVDQVSADFYQFTGGAFRFLFNGAGKAVAFVPVAANAYGTHPAFTTQMEWNIWLTQHGATVPVVPQPTITSFTPTAGAVGSTFVITGTNFTGAMLVSINSGAVASHTVDSATKITAVLSNAQTTGKVRVTTPGSTAVSAANFTVATTAPSAPTITSFTPASGAVGATVTVTGTNFTGATSVKLNGVAIARFTVTNVTTITFAVPTSAASGVIAVTTSGGTATSTGNFTVVGTSFTKPAPTNLIVDNVRNTLRFTHAVQVYSDQFRYRVNGGPLKIMTRVVETDNTVTTFLVGNITAPAGTVEICQVNAQGVQISPFAATTQDFTSGVLAAGLLLESDSIFYNSGMMRDDNLFAPAIISQESEYSRMEGLLDQNGINWTYRVFAFPGRQASQIGTPTSLNHINIDGANYLGNVPGMVFHSGEWINERQKGTSKEQVYAINKQLFIDMRARAVFANLVISGPTDAIIPAQPDGESWETCVAYWTAQLRAEWPTFADGFVDYSDCPYVGVGTVAKGLVDGTYDDVLHQAVPGRLVVLSRLLAVVLGVNGQRVNNDLSAPTLQIAQNAITTLHTSKGAVETSVDNRQTWHIQPIYEVPDQTGTAYVRLVADPSTEVAIPFTVNTGYQSETLAYARASRAAGSKYIKQELYDPAVALLKRTNRLSDVVCAIHNGNGVVLGGATGDRAARLKALIGPDAVQPVIINAPGWDPTANAGTGALNYAVGFETRLNIAFPSTPLPLTLLMRVEDTANGYRGIADLNVSEIGIVGNSGNAYVGTQTASSPNTPLPAVGYHNIILRKSATACTLSVDGAAPVTLTANSGPLTQLTLGALLRPDGTFSLGGCDHIQLAWVMAGTWTDEELNTLATAL